MTTLRSAALALVLFAANPGRTDAIDLESDKKTSEWVTPNSWYTAPPPVQCGSFRPKEHIKAGDQYDDYVCIERGQSICRDNEGGTFGLWNFGLDKDTGCVTLYDPNDDVVFQDYCGATHLCIGQKIENDKEMPYLFIYDAERKVDLAELWCNIGQQGYHPQLKMVDNSDIGHQVPYPVNVVKFKKGSTPDENDDNSLWAILVSPKPDDAHSLEGSIYVNPHCHWKEYTSQVPSSSPRPSTSPRPSSEPSESPAPSASLEPTPEPCQMEHHPCVFDDCCPGSYCYLHNNEHFYSYDWNYWINYCSANPTVSSCMGKCVACLEKEHECKYSEQCCSGMCVKDEHDEYKGTCQDVPHYDGDW